MDYYSILGVDRNATGEDIKKAFKKKAMKYHPDRNPGNKESERKFKEAKEAYDTLSNPQKKSMYDQFGTTDFNTGGQPGGGFHHTGGFGDVFEDIFGDIFGSQGRNSNQAYRGADLEYGLELTLEESVFGIQKNINIQVKDTCSNCSGSGCSSGHSPSTCTSCNGSGQVRMQQGFFSIQQTCPTCKGRGSLITNPCNICHGTGQEQVAKNLSVNIPAGIDSGQRIRLSGKGEAGINGGPSGDLFVRVEVKKHKIFERKDNNLYCDVPISFAIAALGGNVEVPTLSGSVVNVKIPAGTQSSKLFRLKGKGVKAVRGSRIGDMMCVIHIETPLNLSNEQADLLRKFDEKINQSHTKHSPRTQSWIDAIKNIFN